MRARRSCLSVPGTQPRFHAKAAETAADAVFLDLEDSVAPALKEKARAMVVEALRTHRYEGKTRVVRVNACDTKWCYGDIIQVVEEAGDLLDCLMIPKVEDAGQVHFVDNLLSQVESKAGLGKRLGLELQIESALGMENIEEIAASSSRAETLIFGPADFSASLRVPELTVGRLKPEYPGDYWHYFLARVAVAARAHGLQPIDGPYAQVRDLDGLRTFAQRAAMLGFDGKWALNPAQVDVLNEVFTPAQGDFDRAWAVLEAYRQATDVEQTGAVMLGDEMIDEASRKMAQVMVERGESFGMKPSTR
ncbi:MAG: CoA ester lyase [Chloroflexi bacterium]|nr:MAG: CoA ester lyase [Chloroflexota bacterium]TME17563.1 MAG: CoA ester lyase [Chloroflexota bacterium]TME19700.1 MAG: CoA ester lyase [Chloroflexota bacterium]